MLDITTDIGVPCVAAVSCSANGFGFAFGLAARPTLKAAARSAILEMCQLELALAVVEAKRGESGQAALNKRDQGHLRRAAYNRAGGKKHDNCTESPVRMHWISIVQCSECRVQSAEFRVQSAECRVQSAEFRVRVQSAEFSEVARRGWPAGALV